MTDERCKEIMESLGMPNSRSLKQALEQVANETAQYWQKKTADKVRKIVAEYSLKTAKAISDEFGL